MRMLEEKLKGLGSFLALLQRLLLGGLALDLTHKRENSGQSLSCYNLGYL